MTSGGPYLRIVVPLWHGNETHEPHIPPPALGTVMATVALSSNIGELLRPRSGETDADAHMAGLTRQDSHGRAHTAGLTQQGSHSRAHTAGLTPAPFLATSLLQDHCHEY